MPTSNSPQLHWGKGLYPNETLYYHLGCIVRMRVRLYFLWQITGRHRVQDSVLEAFPERPTPLSILKYWPLCVLGLIGVDLHSSGPAYILPPLPPFSSYSDHGGLRVAPFLSSTHSWLHSFIQAVLYAWTSFQAPVCWAFLILASCHGHISLCVCSLSCTHLFSDACFRPGILLAFCWARSTWCEKAEPLVQILPSLRWQNSLLTLQAGQESSHVHFSVCIVSSTTRPNPDWANGLYPDRSNNHAE